MIKLRKPAFFDLTIRYTRMMGENKIRSYIISYANTLNTSKTPDEMVTEYIFKETGEPVEIEEPKSTNAYGTDYAGIAKADYVLENLPNVKKQLEKKEIKSTLHQYETRSPWWHYLFNVIAIPYNWIVLKINRKWENYQWKKLGGFPTTKWGREGLWALRDQIKSIPLLPVAGYRRQVTVCRFFSVVFDESYREQAVEMFRNELTILASKNLIIGHLAMPFTMQLADTVGVSENTFVLCCFLFLDDQKLAKIAGKKSFGEECSKPGFLNEILGLKSEAPEGATGFQFRKHYDMEYVYVCADEAKERQAAYLKSYEEQQEAMKKINKRNVKIIKHQKETSAAHKADAPIAPSEDVSFASFCDADAATLISDKKD